jgi:hypothetical protein
MGKGWTLSSEKQIQMYLKQKKPKTLFTNE